MYQILPLSHQFITHISLKSRPYLKIIVDTFLPPPPKYLCLMMFSFSQIYNSSGVHSVQLIPPSPTTNHYVLYFTSSNYFEDNNRMGHARNPLGGKLLLLFIVLLILPGFQSLFPSESKLPCL